MRHRVKGKTLGRSPSHRAAMLKNLVSSLVEKERVITTLPKAKVAKALAEKLITLGRKGSLHAYRMAISRLGNKDAVAKIFNDLAKRNPSRQGGYTRILRMDELRLGDSVRKVVFEWVDKPVQKEEDSVSTEKDSSKK